MSSDDQHFLDILSSIPNDVKRYSADVAGAFERHFDTMAAAIKEALESHHLLPNTTAAKTAPSRIALPKSPSARYWESARDLVSRNRVLVTAIVAFVGAGGFIIWRRRRRYMRKRRARRASNGARKEVIVLAANATSTITKSLALDLERRGFIIYIAVSTSEEERAVQSEGKVDIRPLELDIGNPVHTKHTLEQFHHLLSNPHQAFAGAASHNLRLVGLILLPDLSYPSGPVEMIPLDQWSDALVVNVISNIATVQAFLPLLQEAKARILLLTPTIVASLSLPYHGLETTVVNALEGFATSLRGELTTSDVEVCNLKLGAFNVGDARRQESGVRANLISWPESFRTVYGRDYAAQNRGSTYDVISSGGGPKGTPLRELHNSVFDALTQRHPAHVWRVGRGSLIYDVVGRWTPSALVEWMIGSRGRSREAADGVAVEDSAQWEKVDSLA